jgi:hypothetical protein
VKAAKPLATYRCLRAQPLWRLPSGQKAPAAIALLQVLLLDSESALPASVFLERLSEELDDLRAWGEDLPQPAQAYAADWLAEKYLVRRFPPGAHEEVYELSAPATAAIRFVAEAKRRALNEIALRQQTADEERHKEAERHEESMAIFAPIQ